MTLEWPRDDAIDSRIYPNVGDFALRRPRANIQVFDMKQAQDLGYMFEENPVVAAKSVAKKSTDEGRAIKTKNEIKQTKSTKKLVVSKSNLKNHSLGSVEKQPSDSEERLNQALQKRAKLILKTGLPITSQFTTPYPYPERISTETHITEMQGAELERILRIQRERSRIFDASQHAVPSGTKTRSSVQIFAADLSMDRLKQKMSDLDYQEKALNRQLETLLSNAESLRNRRRKILQRESDRRAKLLQMQVRQGLMRA